MLEVLIPVAASLLSGIGTGIAGGKRARYQAEQSAIAEEGKSKQEEIAQQQERQSGALSDLIAAYRSSLTE